jgi:hypothetical protein
MSVQVMTQVFNCNMPELKTDKGATVSDSSCKFVLLALADHASEDGEGCYPGVKRICRKTNLSTQTVVNALNALRCNGFTRLDGQSRRHTFNYTILMARIAEFQWLESQDSSGQNHPIPVVRVESSPKPSPKPSSKEHASNGNGHKKGDILDGEIRYNLHPKALRDAFTKYFRFTPNWETKSNSQFMEYLLSVNATPEQVERAAKRWKSDKTFNWSPPNQKGIQEHWLELISEEDHSDPLMNYAKEIGAI